MEKLEDLQKGTIRLNKYLALCGVCSRREADRLVEAGVVEIDGRVATSGERIGGSNQVTVRGKLVGVLEEKVVLAYNKPVGVTCTHKDQYAKKTVIEDLQYPIRITYAGRLDKDSEGLLIMTNDGTLIQEMMRGANGHEKEYQVTVDKKVTNHFLERMRNGIFLQELEVTTRKCQVNQIGKDTFQIVLTQGLNRQIRRMCKECGYEVIQLKRTRVINISLEELEVGTYRKITGMELTTLYHLVGMEL